MKAKTISLFVITILASLTLGIIFINASTKATTLFTQRSLTNASLADIGQQAVSLTETYYPSTSGSAQVVFSRSVTAAELPAMGLGNLNLMTIEEPPLALIIVKGEFDTSRMPGTVAISERLKQHARFIAYVFDLWAGLPDLTITSPTGGTFRKVLNDPSIPAVTADEPIPVSLLPVSQEKKTLHYGDVVPAAAPDKAGN